MIISPLNALFVICFAAEARLHWARARLQYGIMACFIGAGFLTQLPGTYLMAVNLITTVVVS